MGQYIETLSSYVLAMCKNSILEASLIEIARFSNPYK